MYTTGTNCNHEFIVIMSRDEFNDFIDFRLKQERRRGYIEYQENNETGVNDDI